MSRVRRRYRAFLREEIRNAYTNLLDAADILAAVTKVPTSRSRSRLAYSEIAP